MENVTGGSLAGRLTVRVNVTTTRVLVRRYRNAPAIVVNGSAHTSNSVLRTTLATNFYSINIGILSINIIPAPTITCLINGCNYTTNMVVSTSRGPYRCGKVGVFRSANCGLPSRARRGVRTVVLSGGCRVGAGVNNRMNGEVCYGATIRSCVGRIISITRIEFSNLGVTVSATGNSTSIYTGRVFAQLKTGYRVLSSAPGNMGVGLGYNSARPRRLVTFIGTGGLSLNITFSNSTSHVLTISRGNGLISNSGVVTVYTTRVGRSNGLTGGATIIAIVDGVNFFGFYRRGSVGYTGATIKSECILREVLRGNCGVNNRRDNRIVFLSCTAAKSNRLSTIGLVRAVIGDNTALNSLTGVVAICPRILVGIPMAPRNGLGCGGSRCVVSTIRRTRVSLGNSNHILIHISNARPLIHIVLRNGGVRRVAGLNGRVTRIMGRELD